MTKAGKAASLAAERVAAVHDSAEGRFLLAAEFYQAGPHRLVRYGRAELSFLRWSTARGVLNSASARRPGSPWWRAVNDRLLRDKTEAGLLYRGVPGRPSARSVDLWGDFLRAPSAAAWYRAHNASVVGGYLDHEPLAAAELAAERLMMNVALARVLFTHAMVARPELALGAFAPLGRWLGDPRRGSVGFFLDLRHSFPARYPLSGAVVEDVFRRGRLPWVLDHGIILPRLAELYAFAAHSLEQRRIADLVSDGVPCYGGPAARPSAWADGGGAGRLLPRLTAFATRSKRRAQRPPRPSG